MPGFLRAFARLLPLALLTGCAAKSPVLVTAPLLPAAGDPVAYLVGTVAT